MANTDAAFVGSVPEMYTRYMGPMFFEPYAADMASRLRDTISGRLLETACGTGILTRALAAALPSSVAITATDLNEPMLDFAKLQPGGERVQWRQTDAQNLPFPDDTFDVVVCQFGVMFFPDKPRAYREVFRVLKPGGRFLFSVWDRIETNDLGFVVHKAVMKIYPDDRRCSWSERQRVTTILAGSGPTSLEPASRGSQSIPARCPAGRPRRSTRRSGSFKDRRSGPRSQLETLRGSTEP